MSDTETIDAETLRQLRSDRDRYKSDRDDAWARCAAGECESAQLERERADRLRGVVEAVRALADEWERRAGDPGVKPRTRIDLVEAVTALREALASVPSSGEAQSGEVSCGCDRPDPCHMVHQEPFDFAQCETHDTTFPLGGKCEWDGVESITEHLQAKADEQRRRAVVAEMRAEQAEARLAEYAPALDYTAARPLLPREAVVIRDDDEFDDKLDQLDGVSWLYADGHPWIAFCAQDGDWYAIRALTEDDEPTEGYAVTPTPLDTIPYPWALQPVTPLAAVLDTQEADRG